MQTTKKWTFFHKLYTFYISGNFSKRYDKLSAIKKYCICLVRNSSPVRLLATVAL